MKSCFSNLLLLVSRIPSKVIAKILQEVQDKVFSLLRCISELPPAKLHNCKLGDLIWVRSHHKEALGPLWKGLHTVILTTPTAVKANRIKIWIHHTLVNPVPDD